MGPAEWNSDNGAVTAASRKRDTACPMSKNASAKA
jgi:hypothetical protein